MIKYINKHVTYNLIYIYNMPFVIFKLNKFLTAFKRNQKS